jgi:hypothetical protein
LEFKRQQTVGTSTVEAEYIAIAEAAKEALWLRDLLKELGFGKHPHRSDSSPYGQSRSNPSCDQSKQTPENKNILISSIIRYAS